MLVTTKRRLTPLGSIVQAGQHAPGPIPRTGGVGELTDHALLASGALVIAFEDVLSLRNASLQALIARQVSEATQNGRI